MSNGDSPLGRRLNELWARDREIERDEILNGFLDYVSELGLTPYPAQEEAILELLEWKHVILNTPTGSGKSLVAFALHFQAMAENRISYYTCPIKALVNEKFFDLCDAFGPENVGLLTGDASVNSEAPIICCTAEILANMALREEHLQVDYAVLDEFHFYGDKERGAAWQIPLITMRDTVFLMMSATLGDTSHIEKPLKSFTQRDIAVISRSDRPVPLEFEYRETPLHETIQDLLEANEAPIYLVNFTQRSSADQAQNLTSVNICSKQDRRAIAAELDKARFDTPYGKDVKRFLSAGVGLHHAGLMPKYRLLVEKLSQTGLLKVVSGTDSLGVGVNIPIRTVVFTQLSKYDGEKTRLLTAREFHQISGRAGRKGFDDHGRVVVQAPEHIIENKKIEAKLLKNPNLKKKLKMKKPPLKGYVHWDKSTFERLKWSPPEPLEPGFEVTHGVLNNVLQSGAKSPGGGYGRLLEIIARSHVSDTLKKTLKTRAAALFRSLRKAELVEVVRNEGRRGSFARVHPELQENFSLNQSLSLYLVEALDLLDPGSETLALDMLSLVEAILEDPTILLLRQTDGLKDKLIARLKAEGVEYERRMEELEKIERLKPNAEFIYETFNVFAEYHPWLGQENIRPKSIARDMFEKCLGFNDYINDLKAARSEGVLLRYLSQVYKTALQNVPETYFFDQFEDILSFFHTMLKRVDSSLLDEWELMMAGEIVRPRGRREEQERPVRPADIAADPKAFAARVRNELYLLQRSLADRDYEEACTRVFETQENSWTAERFEEAMAPYFEAHASIDITPRARQPVNTLIRETSRRTWQVQQKIVDPEGDEDWALHCVVDMAKPRDEAESLIELLRIGV
jgi:superfamily II DNA/RNA helicase